MLGSTLVYLREQCQLKESRSVSLTQGVVKKNLVYERIPPDSLCKSSLAIELQPVRTNEIEVNGFTNDEIEDILTYACTE